MRLPDLVFAVICAVIFAIRVIARLQVAILGHKPGASVGPDSSNQAEKAERFRDELEALPAESNDAAILSQA